MWFPFVHIKFKGELLFLFLNILLQHHFQYQCRRSLASLTLLRTSLQRSTRVPGFFSILGPRGLVTTMSFSWAPSHEPSPRIPHPWSLPRILISVLFKWLFIFFSVGLPSSIPKSHNSSFSSSYFKFSPQAFHLHPCGFTDNFSCMLNE